MQHAPQRSPIPPRNRETRERRRRRAARLFSQGKSQAEAARQCGVSREAARTWYHTWKQEGVKGLAARKPGPVPRLTDAKKEQVERALLRGPRAFGYTTDLWTLARISALIRQVAHVPYHPGHVWRVLLAMGWSCQKPEPRARERNERAISYWKRVSWPRIQKRGRNLAHGLAF